MGEPDWRARKRKQKLACPWPRTGSSITRRKCKQDCGLGRRLGTRREAAGRNGRGGPGGAGNKTHAPSPPRHPLPARGAAAGGERGCRCAGARAASPSPAVPEARLRRRSPPAPGRLSPERGSKVTTNTATTWSSLHVAQLEAPQVAAAPPGSRLLGGSAAAQPPPPQPSPGLQPAGPGPAAGETARPSANAAAAPRLRAPPWRGEARRGAAAESRGRRGQAQGRAAGTPSPGGLPAAAAARASAHPPRRRRPRPAPARPPPPRPRPASLHRSAACRSRPRRRAPARFAELRAGFEISRMHLRSQDGEKVR